MFAKLPPKGELYPHRDPFRGSLRCHLGLGTPNSEKRYIDFDGQPYRRKDGKSLILGETFIHKARNLSNKTRLILFYDVTCTRQNHYVQFIAKCLLDEIMSAEISSNTPANKTGFINHLSTIYCTYNNNRKKIKKCNKNVYVITKGASCWQ